MYTYLRKEVVGKTKAKKGKGSWKVNGMLKEWREAKRLSVES